MDRKNAKWKSVEDFSKLVVTLSNPLVIEVEKQVSNDQKVTVYWEEESTSSLFDETSVYKVSVNIKLAELLVQSGKCTKAKASLAAEEALMKVLLDSIAQKNAAVETSE